MPSAFFECLLRTNVSHPDTPTVAVNFMHLNGVSVTVLTKVEVLRDYIVVIRWDFYVVCVARKVAPILSTKVNEGCVRFFLS